ncbi:unnamed protein product [Prorocentrum cordatum]|uniref:Uncharacterized protein n=1 Tax=Prorocentrum cordatum TaxID=2364126 RepID=A0ABN9XN35_9DINO|nr:unnamed protein product [Polarella glacialis]
MDLATDADLIRSYEGRVEVARAPPGEPKLGKMTAGINHSRFNLPLHMEFRDIVRPVSCFAHDWMHALGVHGAWNTTLVLLLPDLVAAKVKDAPKNICDLLGQWRLPRRLGVKTNALADVFTPTRWKSCTKSRYAKRTASKAASMHGMIAHFVRQVWLKRGLCTKACEAHLHCSSTLDPLQPVPHGTVNADEHRDLVDKFLRVCLDAGWRDYLHPKFHWSLYLVMEHKKFDTSPACWTHEGKHKDNQRVLSGGESYAIDHAVVVHPLWGVRNTESTETSALPEGTRRHTRGPAGQELQEPKPARDSTATCLCDELQLPVARKASRLTVKSANLSKFKVVQTSGVAIMTPEGGLPMLGQVWLLTEAVQEPRSMVTFFTSLRPTTMASHWRAI